MRKELIISLVIIMIGVSLTFGCTGNETTPTTTTSNKNATIIATPTNGDVIIKAFSFVPETVNISVGETVQWKNEDILSHKIKIEDVESGVLSQGETFSHTFNENGTFNYICTIHPSMKGTVNVN